jgi:hypothetical protein
MSNQHPIKELLAEIQASRSVREHVDPAEVEAYERAQEVWRGTKARIAKAVDDANAILQSSELSAYRFIYEEPIGFLYGTIGIIDDRRHYHVYCTLHFNERAGVYYIEGAYFRPTDDASKPAQITARADDPASIAELLTGLLRYILPQLLP